MTSTDQIAVITGTTHGIGRVTARELVRAGVSLVMLCRDATAAEVLRLQLLRERPEASISIVPCDLGSLASVREAARIVCRDFPGIDLLINNAGIVSVRHQMSVDGYELTFATNHLGPFLLTQLLRDRLRARGRIINVASRAHYRGKLDLENLRDPHCRYRPVAAYDRSKLANVLHTFALARRLNGSGVTANCLHPGVVATNLLPRWLQLIKPWFTPVTLGEERGARSTLHLALSPEVSTWQGLYVDEHQVPQPASALAHDVNLQEALWQASVRYTMIG
jgi:NAD(P)-dependent dehydrogenase (short-subunit alcohol dehydrogenase family)